MKLVEVNEHDRRMASALWDALEVLGIVVDGVGQKDVNRVCEQHFARARWRGFELGIEFAIAEHGRVVREAMDRMGAR